MTYLSYGIFNKKFLTRPIEKITTNPIRILPKDFILPFNSLIHFVGESDQSVGVDSTHPLIRNAIDSIFTFHELELEHKLGNVSLTKFDIKKILSRYHKSHLNIRQISNLDKSLSNNTNPIIINYSLLPKLYKYTSNGLLLYQEWYNIRTTMWNMVKEIGNRREQFILYKLPKTLPTKADFIKYVHNFSISGLNEFYDTDALNLLELWRMITPDVESYINQISEEVLSHVNLVFMESGTLSIIQLEDLIEFAEKDYSKAELDLYNFLDSFISLRTKVDTSHDMDGAIDQNLYNDKIADIIKEHSKAGVISAAETNGLLKLSQKYKSIPDPFGSGKILDEMVVTPKDLKITNTKIVDKLPNVNDESMLYSSLKQMDTDYINNVLYKDIIQTALSIQNAGIIVKDLKVKQKRTAVTKLNTYAMQVQPINGPASTIHFSIPHVNPDGTFEYCETIYRMDKQIGDLPICKTEKDVVGLNSYYGKVFVNRNEGSGNYSKWIIKQLVKRNTDDSNIVTNLTYGINKHLDIKLPRAYTAISETINGFKIKDIYEFNFSLNNFIKTFKETNAYNSADYLLNKAKEEELTPCGIDSNGELIAMDKDGDLYKLWPKNIRSSRAGTIEELGPLASLMDIDEDDIPIEYTEFSIFNLRFPVILAITYMYGLDKALDKLHINYEVMSSSIRTPYDSNKFKLRFKDVTYVIDISNIYNRLLVGGFNSIKNYVNKYKGINLNTQGSYTSILSSLDVTNYHLREVKLLWDMFVDPITKGILIEMGEKTTFYELLLRASSMLIDDFVPDINTTRYKGYERMAGMLYRQIIETVRTHRAQGVIANLGVAMNPQSVLLTILQDETGTLVEQSNPIHNLKEHESYTYSGSGGRKSVTMVKNTRGFTKHDLGIKSEAVPDSSKVGIRGSLSADPNFINMRGMTKVFDMDKDGPAKAVSTSCLNSPAATKNDAKRVRRIDSLY